MNILYILPQSEFGGAERITVDWIRHSAGRNLAIVGGSGRLVSLLEQHACAVFSVKQWRPRNVWSLLAQAAEIVEREKIDLIHSVNYDGHLLGGVLRLRTGRPEIWFNHGPIERVAWSRFARFIPTDALLVASRSMERAQRRTGYLARNLCLHTPGIDGGLFKPDPVSRRAMRAELGLEDETCIAMVARFDPGKGQVSLVQALAELRRRQPERRFAAVFVGGTLQDAGAVAYESEVRQLVTSLGLSAVVRFIGHTDQVGDYMNAADILVQAPTEPESFGLAILEGMAMQSVVLAPREGGPEETIRHREDGYLFAPRNVPALADALAEVQDMARRDPERLAAIGAAARRKVLAHYDIATSTAGLERIYRRIIDRGAPGGRRSLRRGAEGGR